MDEFTGKMEPMNFARVCVEIGVTLILCDHIMVSVFDEIDGCDKHVKIMVEYQNKPVSYSHCNVFGHSILKCPRTKSKWVKKTLPLSLVRVFVPPPLLPFPVLALLMLMLWLMLYLLLMQMTLTLAWVLGALIVRPLFLLLLLFLPLMRNGLP